MSRFQPGAHIHFIGIAGSGMSGIARILHERGYRVSGSDAKESAILQELRTRGVETYVGHKSEQVGDASYVVISSAIDSQNPELIAAQRSGTEILHRASALSRLLPGKFAIAVAGTHGKTTTSGMLAHLLDGIERDPSFVIGSKVTSLSESARDGDGAEFVVEADESDGSFREYRPDAAIITNVELDHVDNFMDLNEILDLFTEFIATVKTFVVVCGDDANAISLKIPERLTRFLYGTGADCDLRITRIEEESEGISGDLVWKGEEIGRLTLRVPGRHNLLNAGAVMATILAMNLPVTPKVAVESLKRFAGTSRRFEIKGEANGIVVVDDYGHHPTEIEATIHAARSYLTSRGGGRLALVFQPHRYSRTAAFHAEFVNALNLADYVVLLEIYSAGEAKIEGVTSASIASKLKEGVFLSDRSDVMKTVASWARPGDLILTLGAGDVTELGPKIVDELGRRR